MASTRSKERTHRRHPASSTDSPRGALAALARGAARMQIAGCTAAAMSFAGWAQTVDRFAQDVAHELSLRVDGKSDFADLVAHLSRATSSHLHELRTLPRAATDHFDARLARASNDT